MFEKEIILKEQLAARCLFQCSPAGNRQPTLTRWMHKRSRVKVREVKASQLAYISQPDAVARVTETVVRAIK